jgi:hypothetical protein
MVFFNLKPRIWKVLFLFLFSFGSLLIPKSFLKDIIEIFFSKLHTIDKTSFKNFLDVERYLDAYLNNYLSFHLIYQQNNG